MVWLRLAVLRVDRSGQERAIWVHWGRNQTRTSGDWRNCKRRGLTSFHDDVVRSCGGGVEGRREEDLWVNGIGKFSRGEGEQ